MAVLIPIKFSVGFETGTAARCSGIKESQFIGAAIKVVTDSGRNLCHICFTLMNYTFFPSWTRYGEESSMQTPNGWSSKVRIEADSRAPMTFSVRDFMTTHLILDGDWHTLRHNEEVKASFNYVIDGKINFLHLNGRVRLNRMHGITLEFESSSILRQMSRRLLKGMRYENPCYFLVKQVLGRPAYQTAPSSASES